MPHNQTAPFDLDRFVDDCHAGLREDRSPRAVREVLARAVAEPAAILKTLGEPKRGRVDTLHRSAELTVLHVVWAPRMTVMPHARTIARPRRGRQAGRRSARGARTRLPQRRTDGTGRAGGTRE
jgi:hypothetical protein